MLVLLLAQESSGSPEVLEWLLDVSKLGIGALLATGGVVLGSWLDRRARREERKDAEHAELRKDASEVLGPASILLTSMGPSQYAAFAHEDRYEDIRKRRREANDVRPRLASLAVLWPVAANELNAVERHLGTMPARLEALVERVLDDRDFADYLKDLAGDHTTAENALDRAIRRFADEEESLDT